MRTVHEVSKLAGVSVRTLQYYDKIGLLSPAMRSDVGYRLYDEDDLVRLQQVLLFRELEFSLKEIKRIIDSPDFDQNRALRQQIDLLKLKRERIDGLIELAQSIEKTGVRELSFKAFSSDKIDEYTAEAKASWGHTPAWEAYEKKSAGRTREDERVIGKGMMELFVPFGTMAAEGVDPTSTEATEQAGRIQEFISEHFYPCTDEIFAQLGHAYGCGGEFTQNIDAAAGLGAAAFAARAVEAYLNVKRG